MGGFPEFHDGPFTELLLDLTEGVLQCCATICQTNHVLFSY
ncbi:hypothetical protein KNP414_05738 [Paenibacillus mucilaginosus KNP414]|uniref:Uncharacterized protein n=1 Tax=Paenibacillus mucilaginosus (strain KNP414) TaxID=1036673 RepID=F8FMU1_PAEMK|nr:hypothetical protein KNP414_05738 [Paenibacillus mucilaginosus KNP414]